MLLWQVNTESVAKDEGFKMARKYRDSRGCTRVVYCLVDFALLWGPFQKSCIVILMYIGHPLENTIWELRPAATHVDGE